MLSDCCSRNVFLASENLLTMPDTKRETVKHYQNEYDSKKHNFKKTVRKWSKRLKVNPSQIRIQKMRTKLASCSAKKTVTFSEDLLQLHHSVQEYAIVHELLHLRIRNHGKLFKSLLSVYLPDWEKRAVRLQKCLSDPVL